MKPLFFDTETTSAENGRLVQQACMVQGEAVRQALYRPPVPIELEAMAVHHITEAMVADKPTFEQSGHRPSVQKLFDNNIAVAHNAKFDVGIMAAEGVKIDRYIDTLKVAQAVLDMPQYKLQYLRYALGLKFDREINPHDAEDDVIVLEGLFNALYAEMEHNFGVEGDSVDENMILEAMIEISMKPMLLKKMPFGKHKGLSFETVPHDYLWWLKKQPDLSEDLAYTLNHYLK